MGVAASLVLCGCGPCAVWVGLPPLCCVGGAASLVLCGCGCLIGTASGSPQIAHLNDSLLILKMYS